MVKDFRNIGRVSDSAPDTTTSGLVTSASADDGLLPQHRLIVNVLYGVTVLMLLAGLWLMVGEQSIFPAQTALFVGISLLVMAASELVAIRILKRLFKRQTR